MIDFRLLPSGGGPDWVAIAAAIGSVASGGVLVVGALFAQRYVKRATASVEATLFVNAVGIGIHVRPCIASASLVRLHLARGLERAPSVAVLEYQLSGRTLIVGAPETRETFLGDDVVDPGESVADSEVFLVAPTAATLGWRVRFTFETKRSGKDRYWWWVASTFVPAPPSSTGIQTTSSDPAALAVADDGTMGFGGGHNGSEVRDERGAG